MKHLLAGVPIVCAAAFAQASENNVHEPAQSLAIFKKESFNIQCWQEGKKILDEKGQGALSSATEFSKPRLVFQQVDNDQRAMIVTLGRSLCMIKSM